MKTSRIVAYILLSIAALIFAYEIAATLINHVPGYWIHLVLFVVILAYLILSMVYLKKNDRVLGILVLALFVVFPFVQFLDPNYINGCANPSDIKITNTYILFVIPLFVPGLLLLLSSFKNKKK